MRAHRDAGPPSSTLRATRHGDCWAGAGDRRLRAQTWPGPGSVAEYWKKPGVRVRPRHTATRTERARWKNMRSWILMAPPTHAYLDQKVRHPRVPRRTNLGLTALGGNHGWDVDSSTTGDPGKLTRRRCHRTTNVIASSRGAGGAGWGETTGGTIREGGPVEYMAFPGLARQMAEFWGGPPKVTRDGRKPPPPPARPTRESS